MIELPPELLALPLLAVAAGVDLYLTLLLLGAAPTLGLWDAPLPGALADLDSPSVLIVVGLFYLIEFAAERIPAAALLWNGAHAVIRPVSGALLALLVLDGQPTYLLLGGALLAGGLSSLAHAVRSGLSMVRWLGSVQTPSVLLISLLEDVLVLGSVSLVLDHPEWGPAATAFLLLLLAPFAPSFVRAFRFALLLAVSRVSQTLRQRRWLGPDELPDWVRRTLSDDVMAPGGGLRGYPVGAYKLPGAPRFTTGWVVVRGSSPAFVFRRLGSASQLDLGTLSGQDIHERGFFRRLNLETHRKSACCVVFEVSGPSKESLSSEFLFSPPSPGASAQTTDVP